MSVAIKQDEHNLHQSPHGLTLNKRRLGRTNIMVSPICFGSLRLTPQNGIYKETLYNALKGGIHLIDTSGAYGNGASEILIGEVMREFIFDFPQHKDDIVLCTKIGMVQGATLQELNSRKVAGQHVPGLYEITDRLGYCLTPEFIESQLSLSLRRLQVERVDLVLLQNPEQLLKILGNKDDFKKYLKRAFEHLEVEVVKGRIRHYGISSSGFLKKEIAQDYLDLEEVIQVAESITPNHHFSVVQVPFNLFETESLFRENPNGKTFFDRASEKDLGVLTCRPLTSHHRDKVHHFI
ncbi:MAG: aldo/keto reductase, partial [Bdellovibrionales bacterium]|nr:aldo/keto reductase [Bdellovibrionales bacterium]